MHRLDQDYTIQLAIFSESEAIKLLIRRRCLLMHIKDNVSTSEAYPMQLLILWNYNGPT